VSLFRTRRDEPHPSRAARYGVTDRGICCGLRPISNRNKKNIQIPFFAPRFRMAAPSWGRDLLSAEPSLDCNSRHRQGLVHAMELPISEQRKFALGV